MADFTSTANSKGIRRQLKAESKVEYPSTYTTLHL